MFTVLFTIENETERSFVASVYEEHKQRLCAIAYNVLKNTGDAEDCVEATVECLIRHLQAYQTWDEIRRVCFLSRCCKNIALGIYRKNAVRRSMELPLLDSDGSDGVDRESSAESLLVSAEVQTRILSFLNEMDEIYRDLLFFKYFVGMENKEIAMMLQLPVNTVNVYLHRARKILFKAKGGELRELLET